MSSHYSEEIKCPKCGTLVKVDITNGVWPERCTETAECPVCGETICRKNITGDMESSIIALEDTIEPYKQSYLNRKDK